MYRKIRFHRLSQVIKRVDTDMSWKLSERSLPADRGLEKTYIFNVPQTPATRGWDGGKLQKKTALISNVISVPPNPLIVLYFGLWIFIYFCLFKEKVRRGLFSLEIFYWFVWLGV